LERLCSRAGELLIALALVVYIFGILNLSSLDSPISIACGFAGTLLTVTGIMSKMGLISAVMSRRDLVAVTLLITSSLLFTAALLSMILSVQMSYRLTNAPSLGFQGPGSGDYFEQPGLFWGYIFNINRPYVWLMLPLASAGAILLAVAIYIEYSG
jgi:hypothetical protein